MTDTPKEDSAKEVAALEASYKDECAIIGQAYLNVVYEKKRIKDATARRMAILQRLSEIQAKKLDLMQAMAANVPPSNEKASAHDGKK